MSQFTVTRYGHSRFWAVRDSAGDLVCVCVYKRGATEVARRLANLACVNQLQETSSAYKPPLWTPKTLATD
ncbi:MAG TPA: hypothetical protein P5186_16175 [Candidatus Paceibacterota bacterium]|nr:hypothetical protein [Verrucomicrobiota bacterium]HRY49586.1 hypothetical protein [Candidatus Paceibacterota bacterium]